MVCAYLYLAYPKYYKSYMNKVIVSFIIYDIALLLLLNVVTVTVVTPGHIMVVVVIVPLDITLFLFC